MSILLSIILCLILAIYFYLLNKRSKAKIITAIANSEANGDFAQGTICFAGDIEDRKGNHKYILEYKFDVKGETRYCRYKYVPIPDDKSKLPECYRFGRMIYFEGENKRRFHIKEECFFPYSRFHRIHAPEVNIDRNMDVNYWRKNGAISMRTLGKKIDDSSFVRFLREFIRDIRHIL